MKLKIFDLAGAAGLYLIGFFAPVAEWLFLVGLFVCADFVTGVFASMKEGILFSSKKARATIEKLAVYGICVLISKAIQSFFFPEIPTMKMVSSLIAFIELKSIDENVKRITGKSIFGEILKIFKQKKDEK